MTDIVADEKRPLAWYQDTRTVIVCWMMVSTFFIIICLQFRGLPTGAGAELLNTLLGMYVGTGLITAINWWMGSSKGSDSNNEMHTQNARMIDKLTTIVAQSPALLPPPPPAPPIG